MALSYNLNISNTTNAPIPLRFDVPLNIPFLGKPSDYDVSIVRFVLPNFDVPFLTYKDTATLPDGSVVSINDMKMSYNGNSVTQHVNFLPRTTIPNTRGIWDLQQCMQMLNTTIASMYTALNAIATLPTSDMPYFTYSETTQLISFTANKNYFASNLSTPIVVSFDESLLMWLYGFPLYGRDIVDNTPTTYDMLVVDLKDNVTGNYIVMTQQAPSFDRMTDFERIILTTNLPIANEYLGTSTALPIIQDYCPADLNVSTFYNNIVYNAITPYRQTRLLSDSPFYSIRVDCYVAKVSGELVPMTLQPHNSANIKFQFIKHDRNPYC